MTMNYITFNQDYSYLAVGKSPLPPQSPADLAGTARGYRIFTTDPFSKYFETKDGNIAILEMLFSTSLVSLILSPRRLVITNTKVAVPNESRARLTCVAAIYHLRADIRDHSIGSPYVEEAAGHCPRTSDISL